MYVAALAAALAINTLVIAILRHDPWVAYKTALNDSLGSIGGFAQTLNRMTPLLLVAITFSLSRQVGLANIGMDGQIYVGGVLATGIGLSLAPAGLPAWQMVPLVLAGGAMAGAAFVLIAGVLRAAWGVSEIFTTVMLNFVAAYLVEFLCTGPWNDPTAGEAITYPIPRTAALPMLITRGGAHTGVLLACAVAVLTWGLLYRTVPGYEMRAVGANARAALIAGIGVTRVQLIALTLGGGLSGLAGAIEVAGVHERLLVGLTPGYGFMGILVAVLARYHPLVLIPVSFAFAVLVAGSDSLQRTVGFPASAVFLVQALVVIVIMVVEALRARRERYVI